MHEISVIMPVYNTQRFLNKSIRSLLKQSFTDFELILVNDGSTDHSLLYCKALAAVDGRVRVLDFPHIGVAAARAEAVSAAKGKYIGFMDSDDLVEPEYLEHLHTTIEENDADLSMCHYVYEYAHASKNGKYHYDNGTYSGEALETLKKTHLLFDTDKHFPGISLFLWDKLFRKELISANLKYMDRTVARATDNLLALSCFLDSRRVSIIDSYDYHYCVREDSLVGSTNRVLFDETARYRELLKKILREKGYPGLEYKADTLSVYRLLGLKTVFSEREVPSLDDELKQMLLRQSEEEGCPQWAEALREVKAFYLSQT